MFKHPNLKSQSNLASINELYLHSYTGLKLGSQGVWNILQNNHDRKSAEVISTVWNLLALLMLTYTYSGLNMNRTRRWQYAGTDSFWSIAVETSLCSDYYVAVNMILPAFAAAAQCHCCWVPAPAVQHACSLYAASVPDQGYRSISPACRTLSSNPAIC